MGVGVSYFENVRPSGHQLPGECQSPKAGGFGELPKLLQRQFSTGRRRVQKLFSASLVHTVKPLRKGNGLPTCWF